MTLAPADRSPVRLLEKTLAGSVFAISPERKEELLEVVDSCDLSLVISDDRKFSVRINTVTGEITVPVAALEYVWACANAFMVFYDEYGAAQRRGDDQFDITQSPRGQNAVRLFNWALRNMQLSGVDPWPADLPKPEASPTPKSDAHIANEMYLCAMSWILHHEIAHKRLNHPPQAMSNALQEEQAADRAATEWILDQVNDASMKQKRTLGIAIAILSIQAHESLTDSAHDLQTHPRAFQRLEACLYQYSIDENDEVLAVAAANLQILLAQDGSADPDLHQASFDTLVSDFLVAFSRA